MFAGFLMSLALRSNDEYFASMLLRMEATC